MEPELIGDYQCVVKEGPLWHEDEQRVYWTDIVTGRLFRYAPDGARHRPSWDRRDPRGTPRSRVIDGAL